MTTPNTTSPLKSKTVWLYLGAGLLLVGLAIAVGQSTGLAERFILDTVGEKIEGTIEFRSDGKLTLRFDGPDESIYRSSFTPISGILEQTYEEGTATLVHHPEDPRRCQPAGASYRVGSLALVLFCIGFACVLRARRIAMARPNTL